MIYFRLSIKKRAVFMKKLFILIASVITLFARVQAVQAGTSCAPYGGECPVTSQIVVDKLIRDPRSKGEVYVDNLLLSDYKFSPGEDVIFKIVVKNTGNKTKTKEKAYNRSPPVANLCFSQVRPREGF